MDKRKRHPGILQTSALMTRLPAADEQIQTQLAQIQHTLDLVLKEVLDLRRTAMAIDSDALSGLCAAIYDHDHGFYRGRTFTSSCLLADAFDGSEEAAPLRRAIREASGQEEPTASFLARLLRRSVGHFYPWRISQRETRSQSGVMFTVTKMTNFSTPAAAR